MLVLHSQKDCNVQQDGTFTTGTGFALQKNILIE